jgi:hypothetical protein
MVRGMSEIFLESYVTFIVNNKSKSVAYVHNTYVHNNKARNVHYFRESRHILTAIFMCYAPKFIRLLFLYACGLDKGHLGHDPMELNNPYNCQLESSIICANRIFALA